MAEMPENRLFGSLKLSFYKSDQHIKLKYRKYAVLIILENRRLYKTDREIKIDFM